MNNEINAKVAQYKDIISLDLKNLPKVIITAKDGATTTIVKVSGDPKSVNGVEIQNLNGNLVINGPDFGNDIRISSSGGSVSIGNNSIL